MVATNATANIADIRRFYQLITRPGDVREIRIPKSSDGVLYARCDNEESFVRAAAARSGEAQAVYATANPVLPSLLKDGKNVLTQFKAVKDENGVQINGLATDDDIERGAIQYIDIDAGNDPKESSTDEQEAAALKLTDQVYDFLISQGVPVSAMAKTATGNGGGIYFCYEMPNNKEATGIRERFLKVLAWRLGGNDNEPHVDTGVFNAARVVKIPGTMACKGPNTPERPHRLSRFISAPDVPLEPCPRAILEAIADQLPKAPEAPPAQPFHGNGHHIDAEAWLSKYKIPILKIKLTSFGKVFEIPCQWNPEHNHGEGFVIQFTNGALEAGCHHKSCQEKKWHDLRRIYEPDFDKKANFTGYAPIDTTNAKPAEMTNRTNDFTATDTGNARRLVAKFGNVIRYCWERKLWLVYTGTHWQWDTGALITKFAQLTVRDIFHEAVDAGDKDQGSKEKELLAHAMKSESSRAITAMITQAQAIDGIPVKVSQLDTDHRALNFKNGTLDLATGTMRLHSAADYITVCLDMDYDPTAKCPEWEKFLLWAMAGDQAMIAYLQRVAGYCLTGLTRSQVFFFFFGFGSNGKTVFTMTLRDMLGDYAGKCSAAALMVDRGAAGRGHNEGIANLQGKRLVVASEIGDGAQLATETVKDMTGGESIKASRKHEHEVEYKPTHKLIMFGNFKPRITDSTKGLWRRMEMTHWTQTVPDGERDLDYAEKKIKPEWPGIMAWAVRGWLECQKIGTAPPSATKEATGAYQKESDELAEFLEDTCIFEPDAKYPKGEMNTDYSVWCAAHNQVRLGQKDFKDKLMEKGVLDGRDKKIGRFWGGIRKIRPMDLDPAPAAPETPETGVNESNGDKVTSGDRDLRKDFSTRDTGKSLHQTPSPLVTTPDSAESLVTEPLTGNYETLGIGRDEVAAIWTADGTPDVPVPGGHTSNLLDALDRPGQPDGVIAALIDYVFAARVRIGKKETTEER